VDKNKITILFNLIKFKKNFPYKKN